MRPTALVVLAALAACAGSPPATNTTPVTAPAAPAIVADAGAPYDAAVPAQDAADATDTPDAPPGLAGDAERRYREGLAAAERNDPLAAARLFAEAYAAAPSLALAFDTFRMFERAASVAEAERWHARALTHAPPPAVRADLDQRMASLRDFARRRREDIARPPPGADALVREASQWFTRGVGFYQRRQYRPALEAFEAALRYAQESRVEPAELYFNLAVTHEHLGDRAEAAAAFRSFLARRPDAPDRANVEQRIRALGQ